MFRVILQIKSNDLHCLLLPKIFIGLIVNLFETFFYKYKHINNFDLQKCLTCLILTEFFLYIYLFDMKNAKSVNH